MASKGMWFGAGAIVIGGLVGKQLLWDKISTSVLEKREQEHQQAHRELHAAYERSQQFSLPTLTAAQREKAIRLHEASILKLSREVGKDEV